MLKLVTSVLALALLVPLLAGMLGMIDGLAMGSSFGVPNTIWMALGEMAALVLLCGVTTIALRSSHEDFE